MADATSADDRLPWLDSPRPAKGARPRRRTRHARTPLLLLLGLFLASTVAVMAFLAGRGSVPIALAPSGDEQAPAAVEPVPAPPPMAAPVPTPDPLPLPPPTAPIPAATPPAAAPVRAAADEPRATRSAVERQVRERRPVARAQRATARRSVRRARPTPPRYQWPATSTAGPSGRVIQLGAYVSGRQTMASWRRLRRAYPYLATLPRKVTVVSPGAGRPHYYRLRIGARSSAHARAICDNLHRIGRGCIVV